MDQVREEGYGTLTAAVINTLSEMALKHENIIFWADSRRDIKRYRNLTVKVNQFEVAGIRNPSPDDCVELETIIKETEKLAEFLGSPVFTTAAERGVQVSGPDAATIPAVKG